MMSKGEMQVFLSSLKLMQTYLANIDANVDIHTNTTKAKAECDAMIKVLKTFIK